MSASPPVVLPTTPRVSSDEIRGRQDRLRELARERGLDAVLVWSHGASTQDHYADVYYFSGFYSHYPTIPDLPPRWRAKGYCGLIVPVEGPVTLVSDLATFNEDLTVVDRSDADQDVVAAAIRALEEVGDGEVGVLGSKPISYLWMDAIREAIGDRLVPADDMGWRLRWLKSPAEQELIRLAGEVGVLGVEAVMDAAVPGATEADIVAAGYEAVVAAGGMIYGISISTGPYAHMYAQSQPAPFDSRRVLESGDMARIDFYGSVDGYLFDFGRSRVVGREPDQRQLDLLTSARDTVLAGVELARPGARLSDIANACQAALEASPFGQLPEALAPEFFSFGHSLGLTWEEPWVDSESDAVLEPGAYIAVEKRVALPGVGGATYEDNLLITEDGCEVVTPARWEY
jgi:Xaa-Pro aminopeptidase